MAEAERWPWENDPAVALVERREALRRLCSRDSTNYSARDRSEHRADLGRVESELRTMQPAKRKRRLRRKLRAALTPEAQDAE